MNSLNLKKGYDLMVLKKYEEAIIELTNFLLINPENIDALLSIGNALRHLDKNDEAIL